MATSSAADHLRQALTEGLSQHSAETVSLAEALFADAADDELQPFAPAALIRLAREGYGFLARRKPGEALIRITPAGPGLEGLSRLETANDDMPFLVDSLLALLTERGHEIRLVLHPVLTVSRDGAGGLTRIAPAGPAPAGALRESYIVILTGALSAAEASHLEQAMATVLCDVRAAVTDWTSMQARLRQLLQRWRQVPPPVPVAELSESVAFLEWLLENHFTFLGTREITYRQTSQGLAGAILPDSGLGILRDSEAVLTGEVDEAGLMRPDIAAFLQEPDLLIIGKADRRSTVHRRAQLDYVGIKLHDEAGNLAGELRLAGLYTSAAYTQNPGEIPLVRRKIAHVITASGFAAMSHSGKALQNVLETWPRDELLQMPVSELEAMAHGILKLEERPRPRLFLRSDRFDRFVSAFVFIPRDRFSTDVRIKVADILARAFAARPVSFAPSFRESALVRVHYVLRRGEAPLSSPPDAATLEAAITEAVRSWADRLGDALATRANGDGLRLRHRWAGAFPLDYTDSNSPQEALTDLAELDRLEGTSAIGALFQPMPPGAAGPIRVKLYRLGAAIPLSERLPVLENMGLKAIEETSYTLSPREPAGDMVRAFIHEVILAPARGVITLDADLATRLAETFLAVWNGLAENDAYNSLVLLRPMRWREATLLRTIGRFLRQAGIAYSNAYVATSLVNHAAIAEDIFRLFACRFDPDEAASSAAGETEIRARIETALSAVQSLDEDRILRRFIAIIDATLRTNYFAAATPETPIALKLASRRIDGLPEPRPFAEIFVCSPAVEGVHLRGGRIARGGIRWSDRPEDFRTEVLGLVKAQNVKNAVIVPVGAKGGFVPKRLSAAMNREAFQAEGIAAYKSFISCLLSLTDNLDTAAHVVPPEHVRRRDGDDPYLVVAADKGTATFSDTANALAAAHGFWLDDAFASGGSAGYDHKKMGITARGGFEAVRRHFRELGTDIDKTAFTVAGVGDMSGDVFGNGMLLSRNICLIAAFDHRDIFIDPEPDPARSYAERERLFGLTRSSWQDYAPGLISEGGGVYARSLKSVPLSAKARAVLGLGDGPLAPADVMSAILKAPVDLLWFGGIGTYVRATSESNADAGDKANDALRVSAADLKARIIGEGANLALTQRARIEFALGGGRINTDAVDNSAGVNSSDYEVNIKIALGAALRAGDLAPEDRNAFLASMTDEVAALVLRNNRLQTLCLTLAERRAADELGYDARVITRFEAAGELDRRLEFLPEASQIRERERAGRGLTRPELAVLMAYAKLIFHEQLMANDSLDDPYLDRELLRYFPAAMTARFGKEITGHRLRREIIATMLANSAINRLGPSFPERLCEETGAGAAGFMRAFLLARDSFGFTALNDHIDALAGGLAPEALLGAQLELQLFIRRATVWFLRNEDATAGLSALAQSYGSGITQIAAMLADVLPETYRARLSARTASLTAAGFGPKEARALAALRYLQRAPDIVQVAAQTGRDMASVARVLYASSAELGIDRLVGQAARMPAPEFYDRLAVNRTIDQIFRSHRAIVVSAVAMGDGPQAWQSWTASHADGLAKSESAIADLASGPITLARLMVAASELQELATR